MPRRLTKKGALTDPRVLSARRNMPFVLCFSVQLQNHYESKDLKQADIAAFHRFYTKVVGMPYSQADRFLRDPDTNDLTDDGLQIQHYEVSESFRIHGVLRDGQFHVIRLDPGHRVHR